MGPRQRGSGASHAAAPAGGRPAVQSPHVGAARGPLLPTGSRRRACHPQRRRAAARPVAGRLGRATLPALPRHPSRTRVWQSPRPVDRARLGRLRLPRRDALPRPERRAGANHSTRGEAMPQRRRHGLGELVGIRRPDEVLAVASVLGPTAFPRVTSAAWSFRDAAEATDGNGRLRPTIHIPAHAP